MKNINCQKNFIVFALPVTKDNINLFQVDLSSLRHLETSGF